MTKPFDIELPAWTAAKGYYMMKSRAMHTATPGLLLTEAPEAEGYYKLTHAASKYSILSAEYAATHDAFGLFVLAEALAAAGDWSRGTAEIAADMELASAATAIVKASPIEWAEARPSKGLNQASAAVIAEATKSGKN